MLQNATIYPSLRAHGNLYNRREGLGDTTALVTKGLTVARNVDYTLVSNVGPLVNVITAAMPDLTGSDGSRLRSAQMWEDKVRNKGAHRALGRLPEQDPELGPRRLGSRRIPKPRRAGCESIRHGVGVDGVARAFQKIVFAIADPKVSAEFMGELSAIPIHPQMDHLRTRR